MPTPIFGVADAVDVVIGPRATCVILRDGRVLCWGEMSHAGRVSGGSAAVEPRVVPWLHGAKALALGPDHSCALFSGKDVRCWGDNDSGQLGDGTTAEREHPVDVRW